MKNRALVWLSASVLGGWTGTTHAENWPQWRGPTGNGVSSEKDLPEVWGAERNIRWRAPLEGLGTSTPVVWNERVFVTSQVGLGPLDRRGAEFPAAVAAREPRSGIATVVDARDGRTVWRERVGGAFTASPVAGDGKVYLLNESGETFVFEPGPTPKLLAKNTLDLRTLASPAISNGTIYIRSDAKIVAIGQDVKRR